MQNALHLISETKKYSSLNASNQPNREDLSSSGTLTDSSNNDSIPSEKNWTNDRVKLNELNLKLASMLIQAGCDMNHKDFNAHETPAFRAIVTNNYDLVKLFVIEGLDLSLRNMYGNDVLSRSIQLGRFRIARLLIAAHSPIRVYSCFFKIPSIDELNRYVLFEVFDFG
jgi:ankyrin repeat protein